LSTTHDLASTISNDNDLAAVKRLLFDFRQRIQSVDADLCALYVALDGGPGALSELADRVLDRE